MFIRSSELDVRGPYKRERRRQLEVAGIYPPRIALPGGQNVWLEAELHTWERAAAAGASPDSLKALVCRLVEARASAAADILSNAQNCALEPTP